MKRVFDSLANAASRAAGSAPAFAIAVTILVIWALTGPLLHFSDTWQLIINTGTTIVTFLMVFLVQHTQNKNDLALQAKLDTLIEAIEGTNERLVAIDERPEDEVKRERGT